MADDESQTKVKDLVAAFARAATRRAVQPDEQEAPAPELDAATQSDLERWFGLPSFQQLAQPAQGDRPEPQVVLDPEMLAVRERRAKAIAAVDPAMVEAHRKRVEPDRDLHTFRIAIETHVDPDITCIDQSQIARGHSIAEPREVEIPEQLSDDLRECTPQAVLRDLHRPETDFSKGFEVIDYGARVDVSGTVDEVMGTRFKLPVQTRVLALVDEDLGVGRVQRAQPWVNVLSLNLANRRVVEDNKP